MKNKLPATKSKFCVLAQVCNLIPGHLVSKLARKHGIEVLLLRCAHPFGAASGWLSRYARLKQIKQTLKVCDFLGHNKEAIRWPLWSALLLYVLLRYQGQAMAWPHSFARLFTMIRGVIWDRISLSSLLDFYGTARERWRMRAAPETAFLPGFAPLTYGTATA